MFCISPGRMAAEAPAWILRGLSPRPTVVLLRHREALGDTLMLSALARGLKRFDPKLRVEVVCRRPELFAGNPHVDQARGWHLWRRRHTSGQSYKREELAEPVHVVEIQWRKLWRDLAEQGFPGASGEPPAPLDGVHPEIFLTAAEREQGRARAGALGPEEKPLILLGSGGKLKPTHNREWGRENYQGLVDLLAPHARLAQIGGDDRLAAGGAALPDFGALPVREAAALFAAADALLVQEGGLMHTARAVGAPTVAIFGGYVLPSQTGYAEQTNLWARPECSPCIPASVNCPHLKCMVEITPRRVLEALSDLVAKRRGEGLPAVAIAKASSAWQPPSFVDPAQLAEARRAAVPRAETPAREG
ncbi:MAG: hypothetical protein M5U26_17670 [Planctomycetota bacterium]|nr:hypothetical protein [Planctomycetota bacterium]